MFEIIFKKKDSPQYEIRVALSKIIGHKGIYTTDQVAKEIGLNRVTIIKFLFKEEDVEFMTLLRIVDYIETQNEPMKG